MKHVVRGFVVLLVASVLAGCDRQTDDTIVSPSMGTPEGLQKVDVGSAGSGIAYQKLYAGKTTEAGSVSYDDIDTNNDGTADALKISYETINGWQLTEVHFFIGNTLAEMPTTRSGNPQVGLFPYKSGNISGQTSYSFTIPFAVLGFSCPGPEDYFVAAHAALRNSVTGATETGWGNGLPLVERGNWAMFNMIYVSCDPTVAPVKAATQTAFAYGGQYAQSFNNFSAFIDNPNRWGWTNGPLVAGIYNFPIYAGAGQSDISKGTLVGTLLVNYTGSMATVTYTINGSNPTTGIAYSLKEVHLYVGSELFPRDKQGDYTISPGQYPKKVGSLEATTQTFTVSGLSGDVYLIAHAVVYGFPGN